MKSSTRISESGSGVACISQILSVARRLGVSFVKERRHTLSSALSREGHRAGVSFAPDGLRKARCLTELKGAFGDREASGEKDDSREPAP